MAIFRKKQNRAGETMVYHEEDSSIRKEVSKKTHKGRRGKWVCGSRASKQVIVEDNKISPKNSYSSSTDSSDADKRDDRQASQTRAATRKSSVRDQQPSMELEKSIILSAPPPAAESAFYGTPRFDWIDVEYHAATRVQKVFRRYLVQKEMEHSGLTTSYIRNRRRQRKAKAANFPTSMEETAPDLGFGCCSMSLALCDEGFDASDNIAYNDFQRMQYEEKIRSQKEREDFLSQSYLEQKGIPSKAVELDQTKFQDQMLLDL